MAGNRSSFIKDLTIIPDLSNDNLFVLSDGTADPQTNVIAYKSSMGDIGAFIGEHSLITPVIIRDQDVFTASVGTITISGATATLSSSVDHAALVVGDILVLPTYPTTVVQAVGTYPNITVIPSIDITTGISFFYGTATLSTEDTSGNIINTLSYGGITSLGTLLIVGSSEIAEVSYFNSGGLSVVGEIAATDAVRCSTYTSYPTVGYCDIRSADDVYIVQRNIDDGMVTYYHRPFLNATMSSGQAFGPSVWVPLEYDVINASDAQGTTKYRNVVGAPAYDTVNYAYPVPYSVDYPEAAYMVKASVSVEVTAGTNDAFYLSVFSGSTATGDQLILAEYFYVFGMTVILREFVFDVSRMVYLKPLTNIYHRWIRVKAYLTNGGPNVAIVNNIDEQSFFNLVCLG